MFTIETPNTRLNGEPLKIEYSSFVFSGGEIQVKITDTFQLLNQRIIRIRADLTNAEKLIELGLLVDAIRRINSKIEISLLCPYFPGARQDRVCDQGEPLSAKFYAEFINNLKFDEVEVWDAHSDVSLALLNNVTNIGPDRFLEGVLTPATIQSYVVVAPDAGAMKKVDKVARRFGVPVVLGGKHRNPATGAITGSWIDYNPSIIGDRKLLIVDDIVDGGATYVGLAKAINISRTSEKNKIELYVTHGIFSKGLDVLTNAGIEKIYTANPFPSVDLKNPNLILVNRN